MYYFFYNEIKALTDIACIDNKLQVSCDNSPESAVCHVTGFDNDKHYVCLKNPRSSTVSDLYILLYLECHE